MVSAVKDLAMELGRTPTRQEFEDRTVGGNYRLRKIGGYSVLMQAAGLDPTPAGGQPKKKITNAVFDRKIEDVLDNYKPREIPPKQPWPRIAVISDIHWPFHNQKVIDAFLAFISENAPEYVIINGDAWDMYAHSKYPRSLMGFSPREEQDLSRKANEEFWIEVKRRAPKAKCIQMLGNHDIRPLKRVLEAYPAAEDWVDQMLRQLFTFDGVQTIYDSREEMMLPGNIMVHHGYRSKLGDHRDYAHCNAIIGHTHLGGSVFRQIRGQVLWELNSGVAGDPEAKQLSYSPQKITHWTPGFGWVDEHGPRFIPV
jgi:predicted phosphodiesterase